MHFAFDDWLSLRMRQTSQPEPEPELLASTHIPHPHVLVPEPMINYDRAIMLHHAAATLAQATSDWHRQACYEASAALCAASGADLHVQASYTNWHWQAQHAANGADLHVQASNADWHWQAQHAVSGPIMQPAEHTNMDAQQAHCLPPMPPPPRTQCIQPPPGHHTHISGEIHMQKRLQLDGKIQALHRLERCPGYHDHPCSNNALLRHKPRCGDCQKLMGLPPDDPQVVRAAARHMRGGSMPMMPNLHAGVITAADHNMTGQEWLTYGMDSGITLQIRTKNDTFTRAEFLWHQWSKRLCAASRLAGNRAEFAASSTNYQLGHRLESMIVQRDSPILQSMIVQKWTLLIVLLGYREVSGHGVMLSWREARDGFIG